MLTSLNITYIMKQTRAIQLNNDLKELEQSSQHKC